MFSKNKANKIKRMLDLQEVGGRHLCYISTVGYLSDDNIRHENFIILTLESMKQEFISFIDKKIEDIKSL